MSRIDWRFRFDRTGTLVVYHWPAVLRSGGAQH